MNHPGLLVLLTVAGLYVAKLWRDDYRAARRGAPQRGSLPGATAAPRRAVVIAAAGAIVLLAAETAGEIQLGIAAEQTRMTWWFAGYSMLAAPIIEEVIFRGWLVLEHRKRVVTWAAAAGASVAFAVLHPFLWSWDAGALHFTPSEKAWFSTGVLFAMSLWLYAARLAPWNPSRSLLPCFVAHAAKNVGVVVLKAATGFMGDAP